MLVYTRETTHDKIMDKNSGEDGDNLLTAIRRTSLKKLRHRRFHDKGKSDDRVIINAPHIWTFRGCMRMLMRKISLRYYIMLILIFICLYWFFLLPDMQTENTNSSAIALPKYQQNLAVNVKLDESNHFVTNHRRAIIFYSPMTAKFINIFSHFFFNSWLYTMSVQQKYRSLYNFNFTNIIDVIVIVPLKYPKSNSNYNMPAQCKSYSDFDESYLLQNDRSESLCIFISSKNSLHNDKSYKHVLDKSYGFLNSIDCIISFKEQHPELFWSYDYFLRSDDDVFITPFLLYQFPSNTSEFVVGEGAYAYNNVTKYKILNISRILGLEHCEQKNKCFNMGSTWYGSPELILRVALRTIEVNRYLVYLFDNNLTDWRLRKEYMESIGEAALNGFFKGVSLLYASDIAINHEIIANESLVLRSFHNEAEYLLLDFDSAQKRYLNSYWDGYRPIHVHVWHGYVTDWFNKMDGFEWNITMQKNIGDFNDFIKLSNEGFAIEWREWCTAIAFDLHRNLSLDLFDVGGLLKEKGIIEEVTSTRKPVLFRADHIPHVTDYW